MIRPIRASDRERLKELGFAHEFSPDFMGGYVATDENDAPVMFAGAWARAEVHMAIDHSWSTPGARFLVLQSLHDAIELQLSRKGVGQAVTWFGGEMKRFKMRLEKWGWVKSELTSWHRRIF